MDIEQLKEYFESLLEEKDLRYQQRFEASEEALAKAAIDLDKRLEAATLALNHRLEGMNEFRSALSDQAATFASNDVVTALKEQVNTLASNEIVVTFRASVDNRLTEMGNRLTRSEERRKAFGDGWSWLVSAISITISIIIASLMFLKKS